MLTNYVQKYNCTSFLIISPSQKYTFQVAENQKISLALFTNGYFIHIKE